ncbi:MAG: hypothetical protein COS84_09975, partial [Armatimonadetes bacterium CG07_land_8_20_14_0_80_40_9]
MGRVRTNIKINGQDCWTLFDRGSRNTYILEDIASSLPLFEIDKPQPVALGGKVHKVVKFCMLFCLVEGLPVQTHARVLEKIGVDEEG